MIRTDRLREHQITLRGTRTVLRPMTETDWDLLARWNSDPEVLWFSEGDDVASRSLEEVQGIYRHVSQTAFCFIIEAGGQPIGECWLQEMNLERILAQYSGKDCRRIDFCHCPAADRSYSRRLQRMAVRVTHLDRLLKEGTMATMILPPQHQPENNSESLLQVTIHLQVTVMAPKTARHKANVWLSMNAGHLLLAETPELVLGDPLHWRFDVVRSLPRRERPGTGQRAMVGRMLMDAVSGEIVNSKALIEELTVNAKALADHAT